MKLSLNTIGKDGVIRLKADGAITGHDYDPTGPGPLGQLLGPNWAEMRVIIDMDRCNYMDSAGVGWLIKVNSRFKAAGGRFAIYAVQPQVRQSLDLLKVGKVVAIVEDEEAALAVVNAGGEK